MSYSSVPEATVSLMIGLIVACCTLGSMCKTTCPPRWIKPRIGGLSFSNVPRPGAPCSLRHRPGRPLLPPRPVGPCARPQRKLRRSRPGLPVCLAVPAPLGRVCKRLHPEQDHADVDHGEVVVAALFIAGGDAPGLFEAVDEPLDLVA